MEVTWTLVVDFDNQSQPVGADIFFGKGAPHWTGGVDGALIWDAMGSLPEARQLWDSNGFRAWVTVSDGKATWGDHKGPLTKLYPHLRKYR